MQNEPTPDPAAQPRKWRRGDVGPDGRIFWNYCKASKSGAVWKTPEAFQASLAYKAANRDEQNRKQRERSKRPETRERYRRKVSLWRARNKARFDNTSRAWREADPSRARRYRMTAHARKRADPAKWAIHKLRARLQKAVRSKYVRSVERDSAAFLLWLAVKVGADPQNGDAWHIDHPVPLARWTEDLGHPNAPENVRWLRASENLEKRASLPTPEEVAAHLALVEEWKKETQSQK